MRVPTTFIDQVSALLASDFPAAAQSPLRPETHLTYDLGLDSVQLMQLLVLLETRAGYCIPDQGLDAQSMNTLADLQTLLGASSHSVDADEATGLGEPELDVKVHCVVSCLCHPIKRAGLDHRPLYFGVWDAEVFVDERAQLRYHDERVDHRFFLYWFERLYGARVSDWYDPQLSKAKNIDHLQARMARRESWEEVMVMLDLYRLPERENRFALNPFPHYVLLEDHERADQVWMWDPDFRWEGALDRRRVMHAVESPAVAGGVCLDTRALHEPEPEAVAAYFDTCFEPQRNALTETVAGIVQRHLPGEGDRPVEQLGTALAELPVLAIRKYAYEHGLAYFWRALKWPVAEFEQLCDVIEALAKGYDALLYAANKWSHTQRVEDLARLSNHIAEQHQRENRIKRALLRAYRDWCDQTFPVSSSDKVVHS